jgi:hypothetical protein
LRFKAVLSPSNPSAGSAEKLCAARCVMRQDSGNDQDSAAAEGKVSRWWLASSIVIGIVVATVVFAAFYALSELGPGCRAWRGKIGG